MKRQNTDFNSSRSKTHLTGPTQFLILQKGENKNQPPPCLRDGGWDVGGGGALVPGGRGAGRFGAVREEGRATEGLGACLPCPGVLRT